MRKLLVLLTAIACAYTAAILVAIVLVTYAARGMLAGWAYVLEADGYFAVPILALDVACYLLWKAQRSRAQL
jgi:hypothetical protein